VQHALGWPVEPDVLENEQAIFGMHVLTGQLGRHQLRASVVPESRDGFHVDLVAGALDDDDPVDAVDLGQRGMTLPFSGTFLPPRRPSSAVMITLDWQVLDGWARLSARSPANTTSGSRRFRAQASIA